MKKQERKMTISYNYRQLNASTFKALELYNVIKNKVPIKTYRHPESLSDGNKPWLMVHD